MGERRPLRVHPCSAPGRNPCCVVCMDWMTPAERTAALEAVDRTLRAWRRTERRTRQALRDADPGAFDALVRAARGLRERARERRRRPAPVCICPHGRIEMELAHEYGPDCPAHSLEYVLARRRLDREDAYAAGDRRRS